LNRACCPCLPDPPARDSQAGVTLTEVLVAIFLMGVGLLALLAVFRLGALQLAQAIKDDRTGAVAEEAVAFGEAGRALLVDTAHFVEGSLARGSIDPAKAAELRRQHELLKDQAHDLEVRLALRFVFPPQQIGPPVALLAQVHAIRAPLKAIIQLLFLVERQAIVESPL
jgi:prepilin-type N-terminal cleavage/methylation domain-containing protein